MKDSVKASMDALFAEKAKKAAAASTAKSAQENKEDEARKQFQNLIVTVIKPTMESFAAYLEQKGHATNISVQEEQRETTQYGERQVAQDQITMLISPDLKPPYRGGGGLNVPHFSVHLQKAKGTVYFHESTMLPSRGGHAGSCGEAKLSDVTTELLETAIAATLTKTFN
jgi:hypothetical protein